MRTGTAQPPPTGGSYTPSAPFVQPAAPKGRRQPALLALGVALIGVSAAGFVFWNQQASPKSDVLVLAKEVPAGQRLAATDLKVVQMTLSNGVQALTADSETEALKGVATTNLHAGALLTAADVGAAPSVPAGTDVIAVTLKPEITPAGLAPGRQVLLVANRTWPGTVSDGGTSTAKAPPADVIPANPLSYKGTVVAIEGMKVTFAVQQADATQIEQLANDPGRLGVVLLPSGS